MDRAEAKMQAEELHDNFKEFGSVETTQKDVEFFEFTMKMLDGDLSSFTVEELLNEIESRKSTVVLKRVEDLKSVRIDFIKEKIKFLENMSDGAGYAIEVAESIGTGEHEDFKVFKEVLKDIAIDLNNIKELLDESVVG